MSTSTSPEAIWADVVRRKMGLPSQADFEEMEEPKRTWAIYMLNAVERGRGVIGMLRDHGWREGIRFADVGCAYGGYLVAAAEAGATEVVGIDVDEDYLRLGKELLDAHGVRGQLELGSVDDPALLARLPGSGFDVVTCTDVLEHVADPAITLYMLSRYMAPGGRIYLTVPNYRCPAWVKSDPHFQITGITLLPPAQARETAYAIHPWLPRYSVGEYHPLHWYRQRLAELGMQTWLLNAPPGTLHEVAGRLRQDAIEIRRDVIRETHPSLPPELASAIRESVAAWAEQLLADIDPADPDPAQIDEYGVQTWELLVVKR